MNFYNEESPSHHISKKNNKISFMLGAGNIDNTSDYCVINFTSDNQNQQHKKNLLYRYILWFYSLIN